MIQINRGIQAQQRSASAEESAWEGRAGEAEELPAQHHLQPFQQSRRHLLEEAPLHEGRVRPAGATQEAMVPWEPGQEDRLVLVHCHASWESALLPGLTSLWGGHSPSKPSKETLSFSHEHQQISARSCLQAGQREPRAPDQPIPAGAGEKDKWHYWEWEAAEREAKQGKLEVQQLWKVEAHSIHHIPLIKPQTSPLNFIHAIIFTPTFYPFFINYSLFAIHGFRGFRFCWPKLKMPNTNNRVKEYLS